MSLYHGGISQPLFAEAKDWHAPLSFATALACCRPNSVSAALLLPFTLPAALSWSCPCRTNNILSGGINCRA